jgi:hypothetical protein
MAPAQLEALQSRIDRRKEKFGIEMSRDEEGPRFDGRLTITVTDPDQAQPAVEACLEAKVKRWKMVRVERSNGEAQLVYSVKPRRGATLDDVAAVLAQDGSPFVANVEAERWS